MSTATKQSNADFPENLGRYQIVGRLAKGGMAEILLGRLLGPSGFERAVVIKRILPHLAQDDAFVRMFLDEARIVAAIHHPNVAQVHELAHHDGELFMVMEYLDGESADGLIRRLATRHERLEWPLCAYLVAEACAGLHAAHELTSSDGLKQNLVHRDVSPHNIFITYDGGIKVIDFGIALASDRMSRTATGELKGKLAYMSPEHCSGEPLDRRADIFALGIVLYELTTCRRLFARPNDAAVIRAICDEPVMAPSKLDPSYPAELEETCLKALAGPRADRYESAIEMRRDLLVFARTASSRERQLPEELLAARMRGLFADRIATKQEVLRRMRSGSALTRIPAADVDLSAEIPTVAARTTDGGLGSERQPRSPNRGRSSKHRQRRRYAVGAASGIAIGFTLVVVMDLGKPSTNPSQRPRAAREITQTRPDRPLDAAVESEIELSVATTPTGAVVFVDGQPTGPSPIELRLPHGDSPILVEARLAGHVDARRRVLPDKSREVHLDLVPVTVRMRKPPGPGRRAAPRPVRSSPTPSAHDQQPPFHRFD